MLSQERLDARPLHALAATMDEADFREPLLDGSFEIILDDIEHVTWLKAVQIDAVLDLEHRDRIRVAVLRQRSDASTSGAVSKEA